MPAPQEPRCALSEREKRRGGTRGEVRNDRLLNVSEGKWI